MGLNLNRELILLDVESTGIDPQKDRILELGIVALLPNGERKSWMKRFNPGIPIPPGATEIHGITDADVKDKPPFAESAPKIHKFLANRDLGGYNVQAYDLLIVDAELRRCGLKLDMTGVRVIDVMGIYRKKDPRTLSDAVRKYCGRDHSDAHGALADAEATLDVLFGQLAVYPDLEAMDLDELAEFSRQSDKRYADLARKLYYNDDGVLCYGFGKNVDKPVHDDPGYAQWMLKNDFPGSTKDVLREAVR